MARVLETVRYRDRKGLKNGDLLRAAKHESDAFVTMDDGLPDQQDVTSFDLAAPTLKARRKRLEDLVVLVPALRAALGDQKRGRAVRIRPPGEAIRSVSVTRTRGRAARGRPRFHVPSNR